jgi:hypothetical protein
MLVSIQNLLSFGLSKAVTIQVYGSINLRVVL